MTDAAPSRDFTEAEEKEILQRIESALKQAAAGQLGSWTEAELRATMTRRSTSDRS